MRNAYLAEARYETIRMLRAPAFAGPFLVIPIAMYFFFGLLGEQSVQIGQHPARTVYVHRLHGDGHHGSCCSSARVSAAAARRRSST
jgi:hypothetical protein